MKKKNVTNSEMDFIFSFQLKMLLASPISANVIKRCLRRVVVGVSGGVDSAVAALMLKRKGYEVIGVFMRNWDGLNETGICSTDRDAKDAEWTCQQLGIPFHEVNFVKEYWNEVFLYMIHEYKMGFTPNPDILCNKKVKFDPFLKYVNQNFGDSVIATGHYARSSFGVDLENYDPQKGARLLCSADPRKDQTFFLSQINQTALQNIVFPLGSYTKMQIRKIAQEQNLLVAQKKDSTGMCFIGKRNFQSFISEYIDDQPGNFIDYDTGRIVGQHRGIHQWTLGQRCRIGGMLSRYYVALKPINSTDIFVVPEWGHSILYSDTVWTEPPHWIHSQPQDFKTKGHLECLFRFQNTDALVPCRVTINENRLFVTLNSAKRALTAGQFATFYRGNECLGSAKMIHIGPSSIQGQIMNRSSNTNL